MSWPFIAPAVVLERCLWQFSKSGVNFQKLQIFINISLPQKFKLFFLNSWFDASNDHMYTKSFFFFKTSLSPKLWFYRFCPKNVRMTGKSIQFAAKAVLMNRQNNLVIFSFTFFLSNLKKKTQIKLYAFLNHFSIVCIDRLIISAALAALFTHVHIYL